MTNDDPLDAHDRLAAKIAAAQELQQKLGCTFSWAYGQVLRRRKENPQMNFGDER